MPDQGHSAEEPEAVDGELVPGPDDEIAEVRRLPLPEEAHGGRLERSRGVAVPATVAAATGGFLLGVAAFVALRVLRRPATARSLSRRGRRLTGRGGRAVDVQGTKSFLVDVHLLKR